MTSFLKKKKKKKERKKGKEQEKKISKYMQVKQHTSKQQMSQGRNLKRNLKIF